MHPLQRHHVVQRGRGTVPMVFAHGFGCDQQMWRFVAPAFEDTHRVVLFDHVGCGRADVRAYDPVRHASLDGYAQDVVEILEAADLHDVVFVGHSVSAMIGALAARRAPSRLRSLVMLGPSPRYLNDAPEYVGGFEPSDVEALLGMLESNLVGWAAYLAPVVIGPDHAPERVDELKASFCAGDPEVTQRFARATFLGDNRSDLPHVPVPALVVQMRDDAIAPMAVGEYVHRRLPDSRLHVIEGSGHCPHMTHPGETIAAIRAFVGDA